jgi:hypothetical protein
MSRLRNGAKGTAVVLLTSLIVAAPATATAKDTASKSNDPALVSEWNELAQKTFLADTTKSIPEDFLYMGFLHAAVYNAVVGIEGRYEPYHFHTRPQEGLRRRRRSSCGPYDLVTYSPDTQDASLDTAYATSLAKIPDGDAKTRGVTFGELAADTLIAQRKDDGRNAPLSFTQQPAPGVWRPTPAPTTPPNLSPFAVPWMGDVTPLLVKSGAQFGEPGRPPELTSARYTQEFNEVKALGSTDSTKRKATDRDCEVLLRQCLCPVQYGTARPGDHAEIGHRRRSPHVRRCRHEPRRRDHFDLAL